MSVFSRLFGRSKSRPDRTAENQEPISFGGHVEISAEQGLAAHFFRKDNRSWPGIVWAVKCTDGKQQQMFLVRTYFSQNTPDQAEKPALAKRATEHIARRLQNGPIRPDEEHVLE